MNTKAIHHVGSHILYPLLMYVLFQVFWAPLSSLHWFGPISGPHPVNEPSWLTFSVVLFTIMMTLTFLFVFLVDSTSNAPPYKKKNERIPTQSVHTEARGNYPQYPESRTEHHKCFIVAKKLNLHLLQVLLSQDYNAWQNDLKKFVTFPRDGNGLVIASKYHNELVQLLDRRGANWMKPMTELEVDNAHRFFREHGYLYTTPKCLNPCLGEPGQTAGDMIVFVFRADNTIVQMHGTRPDGKPALYGGMGDKPFLTAMEELFEEAIVTMWETHHPNEFVDLAVLEQYRKILLEKFKNTPFKNTPLENKIKKLFLITTPTVQTTMTELKDLISKNDLDPEEAIHFLMMIFKNSTEYAQGVQFLRDNTLTVGCKRMVTNDPRNTTGRVMFTNISMLLLTEPMLEKFYKLLQIPELGASSDNIQSHATLITPHLLLQFFADHGAMTLEMLYLVRAKFPESIPFIDEICDGLDKLLPENMNDEISQKYTSTMRKYYSQVETLADGNQV